MLHGRRVTDAGRRGGEGQQEPLPGDEVGTDTARLRPAAPAAVRGATWEPSPEAAAPQGGTGPGRRGRSGAGREGREEGARTVALAVRKSASWLMLETSGELFMITRMRDRGSDTSRFSPPLNLAAIFYPPPPQPRPAPSLHPQPGEERAGAAARPAGSRSLRPPGGPGALPATSHGGTTTPVKPRAPHAGSPGGGRTTSPAVHLAPRPARALLLPRGGGGTAVPRMHLGALRSRARPSGWRSLHSGPAAEGAGRVSTERCRPRRRREGPQGFPC